MHITQQLPYYAVIFTSMRTTSVENGYQQANRRLTELAKKQPGFVGIETVRQENGFGITISYWRDKQSIRAWREHTEHWIAQQMGKSKWYDWYRVQVCKVERSYVDGKKIPSEFLDTKNTESTDQRMVSGLEG
ncbi:hypothetical protein KS4_37020 [Poriferisphaera corsica]|uniref:ABM domain-containing protein n=1 Tax=Poriferisphaera corsica TaxID=2528020 RepID=A0A517YZJ3_9BACT|nr:antibiotic biosynthesis monooxygenase [Poriferisphaera corsica]QDU35619.1 hypothetical protein KS4_37020 [Poriferisphaera corsica]